METTTTLQEQSTWQLDKAHTKLRFTVTHLMVSEVDGWFKSLTAKILSSKDDFSDATVEMTAEVDSVNTDNEQRDTHLKSAEFFDTTKYPTLTFKSKTFKKVSDNNYKVTGDLTLHGITKPIDLTVLGVTTTHPMTSKIIAGFKITGKIKRSDFGIGTSVPGIILSEEVQITANAEFEKQ
ncbi:MAG: YceI family protein [Chitinophagaceae bacterium]|nr:YceI family protein [Chitinophagaceae bacterium]